ncbi:MAG TPA: NAD-dependent succinate-semialdehyde dehydrogenase [archaeon]|nr:NAD-dependent succinate-semialdehyde dehydrogenase [archaeon]
MRFHTVNPATGEKLKEYSTISKKEAFKALANSTKAFTEWKTLSLRQRIDFIKRAGQVLRGRKGEIAKTIALEMGKPIAQSLAEVEKCAWACDVFFENAEKWLQEEVVQADGLEHRVVFEPLGVVLSIMPWNFPLWQVMRFAIPALAAGNVTLLRHSSVCPESGAWAEKVFTEAGCPEGVFTSIVTDHSTVKALIESPLVSGVSLTGSTAAGSIVGGLAGANLKKLVLELGGSDPFIVLEDADVPFTCAKGVFGRIQSNGQSCIAAKRFIVVKEKAREFTGAFVQAMKAQLVGDPLKPDTQLGPLASKQQLSTLERQVAKGVRQGAKLLCGGKRAKVKGFKKGFYYEPTVAVVKPSNVLAGEEVFGPVAAVIVVEDEKEAVRVANDSEYGLGASVWTKDLERGKRVARQLEAGCVFVNSIVKSDPRLPFGGVKKSGVGRELSHYGLKEFVNVKTVNVYDQK